MENIINQGTPITIEGKEYIVRRLNTMDVFTVAGILSKVYSPSTMKSIKEQSNAESSEAQEFAFSSALISAIPHAQDSIIKLLAGLVGVTTTEFEQFPPDATFDVIEALVKSDDLKRFLDKVQGLLNRTKVMAPATK